MLEIGKKVTVYFPHTETTVKGKITKCLEDGSYICRISKFAEENPGQEVHVVEKNLNRMVILEE